MNEASHPQHRFLGIETGATHTAVLLVSGDGSVLSSFELGPANVRLLQDSAIEHLFREIQQRTGAVSSIASGMAGVRTEADRRRIMALARRVWESTPIYITNDLETAMMAAGPLPDDVQARVLLLSGTGSCAYGTNRSGVTMKFGGRGHLLGDQGSASDIALVALRRIVYQHDLHAEFPSLGRAVLRALQLNDPDDLIPWTQEAEKNEIARLAITVFNECQDGDPLAWSIVDEAADKLADMAWRCAGHLASHSQRIQFVFSGSVLLKQPWFAAMVSRRIHAGWARCRVLRLKRPSVWGAIELARRQLVTRADGAAAPSAQPRPATPEVVSLASLAYSPTEQRNPRSMNLDQLPVIEAVRLMLEEDRRLPDAILEHKEDIAWVVEKIAAAFHAGRRLYYVGAGTSGRLGVLDASECPPTFRSPPEQVQGIMAGGRQALWSAVEGAEDDSEAGAAAVRERGVMQGDVVVGIAASGRTPFVWGALHEGRRLGATTVLLCFNPRLQVAPEHEPDKILRINAGPEIVTGSTRLKSGTATKLVLNIFTTLAMVHTGKVMSNLMIDLNPTNVKLRDRAVRLVRELTGCDRAAAQAALERGGWRVKEAVSFLKETQLS